MKSDYYTDIQNVAEQYRTNGYTIITSPDDDAIPSFLKGFQPDILAYKDNDNVVVEVKPRRTLATDHQLAYLTSLVNSQPGWRLDLVVINTGDATDATMNDYIDRDLDAIASLVIQAKALKDLKQIEAAYMLMWAATEATLRHTAAWHNVELERIPQPQRMIRALFSNGIISRSQYDALMEAMRSRNALVHGFTVSGSLQQSIDFLIPTVEEMLVELRRSASEEPGSKANHSAMPL
jgi:uncharacterized protein YutE (UPF0331/DUF86 family)